MTAKREEVDALTKSTKQQMVRAGGDEGVQAEAKKKHEERVTANKKEFGALTKSIDDVPEAAAGLEENMKVLKNTRPCSIGCSDMVKQNVVVRKPAAVETLGSASVICSDMTGTLTEKKYISFVPLLCRAVLRHDSFQDEGP